MPVKNLLNKVSEQGYAGLSDAEFDTLGKFVEANPQYKDVFNKVSDNGFSALSDDEFGMLKSIPASPAPAPSGYAGYSSPEQAKDLYTRVKFGGYSNLNSRDKELFDKQYASSQAARNGMSLEQARAYADANRTQHMESNGFLEDVKDLPRQFAELPGRMYQGTRDFLANYAGGPLSSLLSGADEYTAVPDSTSPTGERAVERMPGSSYAERVAADQPGEIARGERGEGLPGMLSDPMNATMLIPGLGEYVVGGRLAKMGGLADKVGTLASKYPLTARTLAGGIEGAGYTSAQAALDQNLQQSAGANLLGAGIGAGMGFGGGLLRNVSNESFPGIKVINKKLDRAGGEQYTNAELEAFRRDALKRGFVTPTGLGRLENLEDSYRREASDLYEKALDQVEPKINPEDLQIQRDLRTTQAAIAAQGEQDAFMKRLAAGFDRSMASRAGTNEAIRLDNERILEGIKQKLSNDLFITNKARRLNLTEDEMNRYVDDVVERLRTRAADAPGGSASLTDYTLNPRDVISTKQILNEDIYNKGVGEVTARQRTMAKSLHQSVDKLFDDYRTVSGKSFKEELGEGAQLYKKSARLEDLLQEGKYRRGSYRAGEGVAHYFQLDPMYGLNDIGWRTGAFAPTLAKGINAAVTPTTSKR